MDRWRSIGSKKIGYDHTRPDRSDLIHFNELPSWTTILGDTVIIEKHDDTTTVWFKDKYSSKIFQVYTVPNKDLMREIGNYNARMRPQEDLGAADVGRSAAAVAPVNNAIHMPVEQPVNLVDPRPPTCFGRFCSMFRRTARGGRRRSQRKRKAKKTRRHKKRF